MGAWRQNTELGEDNWPMGMLPLFVWALDLAQANSGGDYNQWGNMPQAACPVCNLMVVDYLEAGNKCVVYDKEGINTVNCKEQLQ